MSPTEIVEATEAYCVIQQREFKRGIAQAWYTAMLSRAKKIPKLEKLLKDKKAKKLNREELVKYAKEKGLRIPKKGGLADGNNP